MMIPSLSIRFFPIAFAFAVLVMVVTAESTRAVPTADGLYATVRTTRGIFTIDLEFEKAPMTVANFVGLAEGSRAWVDFETGQASNAPYFDGQRFHRVVEGFVIQTGSPKNVATVEPSNGPGYQFTDEFHPDLIHDRAGVVSMANSGAATNSSGFFVTVNPSPTRAAHLDQKHSVFGFVVEGLNIVQAIGLLPENSVTIQSVTITRIGAAAQAFDVTAWDLPVVSQTPVEFDVSGSPRLSFTPEPFTAYYGFNSRNLKDWSFFNQPTASFDVSAQVNGQTRQFFRLAEAKHNPIPASVLGSTLELTHTSDPNETLTMTITGAPRGGVPDYGDPLGDFVQVTPGSADVNGTIGAYGWSRNFHRGWLGVGLENVGIRYYFLKFQPDGSSGTFTGGNTTSGPFPYMGTFTVTPIDL